MKNLKLYEEFNGKVSDHHIGDIVLINQEGHPNKYSIDWNDADKQVEISTNNKPGNNGIIVKGKNIHLAMTEFGEYCKTFIDN